LNAVLASVGYPKHLELHNKIAGTTYHMRLQQAIDMKRKVTIRSAPGSHVLLDETFPCTVCEAGAVLGLDVKILEPKSETYLRKGKDIRVCLRVDGEDILKNEPLTKCSPFRGKGFYFPNVLYQAVIPRGDRVGLFAANGTFLKAWISGLPKTKAIVIVELTLDMALYTTRAG
jgi:hypothetical protein